MVVEGMGNDGPAAIPFVLELVDFTLSVSAVGCWSRWKHTALVGV